MKQVAVMQTFSSPRHWPVPDVVEQSLGCTAERWHGAPRDWRALLSIALGAIAALDAADTR